MQELPKAERTVAIGWDQSARISYSQVTALADSSDEKIAFNAPGLQRTTGNLLADQVLPAFSQASDVLVIWTENDPLWIGFQAGLAEGLGKPWRAVANQGEEGSARGLPGEVTAVAGWEELAKVARQGAPKPRAVALGEAPILLCPRETPEDAALLRALGDVVGSREYRVTGPEGKRAKASAPDVLWIVTPHDVRGPDDANLQPNLGNAFEAGRSYGATIAAGASPQLAIVRVGAVPPIVALDHLTRATDGPEQAVAMLRTSAPGALRVTQVSLRDVKCFTEITIPLSTSSPLGGAWTCLAGVNGSGKSTVLQSLAVALLGRQRAAELGLARLARMVRRSQTADVDGAEIRVTLDDGTGPRDVVLPLTTRGIDERRLASLSEGVIAEQLWDQLDRQLIVSYGATRNISDSPSVPLSMSMSAHRQLTLFDPLAQIVSSEALTVGGPRFRPVLTTVAALATAVLNEPPSENTDDQPSPPFACSVDTSGQLVVEREGARLSPLDLPDGFRSVLALLADIASGWHDLHPVSEDAAAVTGEDIEGIVLVDEIDLHLHARLQRQIVPRLRAALPNVQWLITTHSPYIVGSFDQHEIVLLDRTEPSGMRMLDRQVLAFSANEIYDWLLGAPAVSEAGEAEIAKDEGTALLYQSPTRDEEAAKKLLAEQDELLEKLRATKA